MDYTAITLICYMDARVKQLTVLILTISAAILSFLIFGLGHVRTWDDASGYNAIAVNIAEHGFYSLDGVQFTDFREPGYPTFVAIIYKIFGSENFLAVCYIQTLLLGILGYVVYRIFSDYTEDGLGIAAGIFVSAWPSYGYYANEIGTEFLFAFLLGCIFFIAVKILRTTVRLQWSWFIVLGTLCAMATLVRVQLLLFLPFLIICLMLLNHTLQLDIFKKALISFAIFVMIVGGWGLYVWANTGHFAITEGRQGSVFNTRAVRSQLGYGELTEYAFQWIERSISGGARFPMVDKFEQKPLNLQYVAIATTSEMAAQIRAENIRMIRSNTGHYLYGNLIEIMKMLYIEHDYSDSQSRYFRPFLYVVLYTFFLFGLYQLARNWRVKDMRILAVLAIFFPIYNLGILSFLDTIPRFNTPYLMFYIIVGFVGIVLFKRAHGRPQA